MRSRNIKPGFFKNDQLLACEPLARILFEGLWCMADRQGRLEDRPTKIKIEILPCDNCDVDSLLNRLASKREEDGSPALIERYAVENKRYIQITNFLKHQNPHVNEANSIIQAPEQHGASTVQAPEQYTTNPADSLLLIPDSLILIPDSLKKKPLSETEKIVSDGNGKYPPCPQNEIVNLYHKTLPELPQVKHWPENLQALLRQRWKEDPTRQNLTWWEAFFMYVKESDFLTGRTKEVFVADMEWLVHPRNFTKIANGRYHSRGNHSANPQPGIAAWLSERGRICNGMN